MLDIKFIRENKDLISAGAKKKRIKFDVQKLIDVDDKRKELLLSVEEKRKEQNEYSTRISTETDSNRKMGFIEEMRKVKELLQKEESELKEVMKEWQFLMVQVPNIPDVSVPDGDDDTANKEIRTWGEKPSFNFKPKDHVELMNGLGMIDLERGVKISGFRGYVLKGNAALLNYAVWNFIVDHFVDKGDFVPMIVPSLVRREPFIGTGYLPQAEEELYKTQDGDFLAGTAEVSTMAYYMDEIIPKENLPIKFLSFSPCFRREAGSHGKDTKGLMRVHEFFKMEQVILCEASHEESVKFHEEITRNAEELLKKLNIPHRVVINCGGDLGLGQVKKYDIESWVPSENTYRETHSSSYFHDFQTRRLNIRYRDSQGKLRFTHSLNNTALATPRILISIIENNQKEDGSISIPFELQKYLGGKTRFEI